MPENAILINKGNKNSFRNNVVFCTYYRGSKDSRDPSSIFSGWSIFHV